MFIFENPKKAHLQIGSCVSFMTSYIFSEDSNAQTTVNMMNSAYDL